MSSSLLKTPEINPYFSIFPLLFIALPLAMTRRVEQSAICTESEKPDIPQIANCKKKAHPLLSERMGHKPGNNLLSHSFRRTTIGG